MNNRLIFAIITAVVFALAVVLAVIDSTLKPYAFQVLQTVQLIGLMEMLLNGTFISTRYFKITLALFGVFFIGCFITMVHSPFADGIMALSIVGILITYLIHFLGKKPKTFLDVMKLSTLVFMFPLPLFFFRPISVETKNIALLLGHIVFAIAFILYILVGERRMVWYVGKQDKTHGG